MTLPNQLERATGWALETQVMMPTQLSASLRFESCRLESGVSGNESLKRLPDSGLDMQETVEIIQRTMREAAARRGQIRARLVQMQSEIETLELEIASLDEVLAACQRSIDSLLDLPKTSSEHARDFEPESLAVEHVPSGHERRDLPPIEKNVQLKSDRFHDLKIPQAVSVVLREAGRPLHVHQIYNRLREHGFQFGGNHPLITLAVSVARSNRFRRVAPATFDLVIRDAGQVA